VRALLFALAAAAVATAAAAQPKGEPATVLGAWRFETAEYDIAADGRGCRMTGDMTIARGRAANEYACRFVATETCAFGQWSAEQTCVARRRGDRLEIESAIVRLTPANTSYAPDNWSLTIRSSNLMVGELRSADIANVEFRRGPAFTS
jgi:hypothetical protein